MALTYDCLSSYNLGGTATSITISSIPQTATHLRIVMSLRIASSDNIYFRANGQTVSYNEMSLATRGGSAQNYSFSNGDFLVMTGFSGNWPNPLLFEMHIPKYSSTGQHQFFTRGFLSQSTSGSFAYSAGSQNSSSAISSFQVYTQSGVNFTAGTKINVYGIA
jgi:hypothetical protein